MEPKELIRRHVSNDEWRLPEEKEQAKVEHRNFLAHLHAESPGGIAADAVERVRLENLGLGTAMSEEREIARRALERPYLPPANSIPEYRPLG